MNWKGILMLAATAFLLLVFAGNVLSSDAEKPTMIIPATSVAEVKNYLKANPEFPLNRLPESAKSRFLNSLSYNERGIMSFSTAELNYGFSAEELRQIGALIGFPFSSHMIREMSTDDAKKQRAISQVSPEISRAFAKFYAVNKKNVSQQLTKSAYTLAAQSKESAIAEQYKALFSINKNSVDTAKNGDLLLLFRAADIAANYLGSERYSHDMALVLAELKARQLASQWHVAEMYKALLANQAFEQASEFASNYNFLDPLPAIFTPQDLQKDMPTALIVHASENRLTKKSINLQKPFVLVISHPMCHFCQDAITAIEADKELNSLIKNHSFWLSPRPDYLSVNAYQKWNKQHPIAKISLLVDIDRWPRLNYRETPTFYFFEDGKAVAKVLGWPKEGNKEALMQGMRKIGLVK